MEVRIDVLPFFTEIHVFPWTSLSFWISISFNMKNGMAAINFFFSFLRFAKQLRIGNHLLLSCKNRPKGLGRREKVWHHGHIGCPRSPPGPCSKGVENPGKPILPSILQACLCSIAQQGTAAGSRGGTAGCEVRYGLMSESLRFSDKWAAN